MKTPLNYNESIKNKIITPEILTACLYSVNKRAKNWRDQERKWRNSKYDKYDNETKSREEKEYYYFLKDRMLSIVQPTCIHCETIHNVTRERIFDFDDEYLEYKNAGKFFHEGEYFDKDLNDMVSFGDIHLEGDPVYNYYLFYDLGCNHTFHTPINSYDLEITQLEVIHIDQLNTYGYNTNDLISMQFVKKVIALIESGEFQYIEENKQGCDKDV